jgi:hypothetical protein
LTITPPRPPRLPGQGWFRLDLQVIRKVLLCNTYNIRLSQRPVQHRSTGIHTRRPVRPESRLPLSPGCDDPGADGCTTLSIFTLAQAVPSRLPVNKGPGLTSGSVFRDSRETLRALPVRPSATMPLGDQPSGTASRSRFGHSGLAPATSVTTCFLGTGPC